MEVYSVQSLFRLIKLRNEHPSFNGSFSMESSDTNTIKLKWEKDGSFSHLLVDFVSKKYQLEYSEDGETLRLQL